LRNPKSSSSTIFALFVHRKMSNSLFVCSMFNMWQCVYGSSSKSYIRNKFWSSRTNNWLFCSFLTVLLTILFYKWCRMTKMLNYFSKSVIVIRKNIKSSIEFVYSVFEFEIWWLCREVFQIKMTRFFSDILHKKCKTNFFLNFIFDLRQHVPLSMSSRTRIYSVFLKSIKSFLWSIWIPKILFKIGSWLLSEQMTVRISWSTKPMFSKRVSRPKKYVQILISKDTV